MIKRFALFTKSRLAAYLLAVIVYGIGGWFVIGHLLFPVMRYVLLNIVLRITGIAGIFYLNFPDSRPWPLWGAEIGIGLCFLALILPDIISRRFPALAEAYTE